MKLKLIAHTDDQRPKLVDAATGQEVEGVIELIYSWEYHTRPRVTVTIAAPEVELDVHKAPPFRRR